jgi:metallo-beta-lactamase class B
MKRLSVVLITCALGGLLLAQAIPPEAQKLIDNARAIAGTEHQAVWRTVCDSAVALATPPAPRGAGAGRGAAGRGGAAPGPPARASWYSEPQKVFDNLYFVGMTEYSAWALTTSQGIILIDAIFDYSIEAEVDEGLRTLGLNPADIKYVIVSHGHLDHAGGAKFLQDKYGARVLMGAADWDLLDRQNPSWKPKRDMVITDGQALTLGDTTVMLYLTPGHTEGTVSLIFPVRDGSARHTAVTWGGTSFNFGPIRERLMAYERSATRFSGLIAKANADVILSNHTAFDRTPIHLPTLRTRRAGERHPYVIGTEAVQRYVRSVGECAKAALVITAGRGTN